jgi:hypothetical protein
MFPDTALVFKNEFMPSVLIPIDEKSIPAKN